MKKQILLASLLFVNMAAFCDETSLSGFQRFKKGLWGTASSAATLATGFGTAYMGAAAYASATYTKDVPLIFRIMGAKKEFEAHAAFNTIATGLIALGCLWATKLFAQYAGNSFKAMFTGKTESKK